MLALCDGGGPRCLGARSWITFLNGTRTDYRYYNQSGDQSQRLKQVKITKGGTVLLDLTYSYDAVSNVTGLTDATPTRNESLTYGYDDLNRLTAVSGATPPTTRYFRTAYQYDEYGNLSQTTEYGEVQADYTTDIPGDERTTASIYRYRIDEDANGVSRYLVDRPVERSVYEGTAAAENQLAARTQFSYDGAGPWPDNTIGDRGQLQQERVWTGSVWAITQYQ